MRHREQGSALLVTVFLLAIITMLGVGILATATTDLKISSNYEYANKALYAAEAGAQYAVALLAENPAIGQYTPDPSGTPMYSGTIDKFAFNVWLWNQRYYEGTGGSVPFEYASMRQVVVEATDGQRVRKIVGVVQPSIPKVLKYAVFGCNTVYFVDLDDSVTGNIYAAGDMEFSGALSGSIHGDGNVDLPEGSVTGNVFATGDINDTSQADVSGACKAGGDIQRTQDCGTAQEFMTTSPVRELCDNTLSTFDPSMFSLTVGEVNSMEDRVSYANKHFPWVGTANITLAGEAHYSMGTTTFYGNTITYSGDNVILVEDGDLLCVNCSFVPADSAATMFIVLYGTLGGTIRFDASTPKTSVIQGIVWAGLLDTSYTPSNGSLIVNNEAQVTVKGEIVILGRTGTISTPEAGGYLHVEKASYMPPWMVNTDDGFQIAEWREVR